MENFVKLTIDNFNQYKNLIESSEEIYPSELRTSIEDYQDMISDACSISFLLFEDSNYVGNIIGTEPLEEEDFIFNGKVIYVYNLLTLPQFQGKGYGLKLMNKFIETAKKAGYRYIAGHFRTNGSYRIAQKFKPIFEKKIKNWENSGEDFVYCVIELITNTN
jgi:GNAT superfamily N-acetyltransferase